MKRKILSVVMSAILLLSVLAVVSSCTEKESGQNENYKQNDNKDDMPENPLENRFSPNVPSDLKFDGRTFSVLIGSVGQVMYAEEENSNIINDTVYRNNTLVAEHFGINLNIVKTNAAATGEGQKEAAARFRTLIETDDKTYHAFMHVLQGDMPQMILEKYFVDWNTLPYINLEDEWWYQNITDDLCFGDKIYVMTGDYARYIDSIDCLVFNKDIFDSLGLDYPYQDVLDGTWTWDKFEELVSQGAKDLNGDGLMTYENDRWGLVGWGPEIAYALLASTGYSPLSRDSDGMPVLNRDISESDKKFGSVVDIFADGQSAWCEFTDYNSQIKTFTEGRAMFKDTFLSGVTGFSEAEFDFGIIPYPKWNEDMPYMNRSSNMTALTYIPVTNDDLDLTGAVLEELAFRSAKTLTPAYFDTVLTVKSTRDVQSEEMLPVIKDNARFLYSGYCPSVHLMVARKNNTFSSDYASALPEYQTELEEMRELLASEK